MKRNWLIVLCGIMLMPFVSMHADEDCDETLAEAKKAYNAGEYTKAKKYFDYVVDVCGASYGNAASWSKKCKDAATPKLSVSRTSISVGAASGTTSVTVTSNRTWKLSNTGSSLFTVSKNGDKVTINYSANSSTTSRSDYFDVVTTDGSKSVRVRITQDAKEITEPYLTVSQTSISASASGTTKTLTVSSNIAWEVQYPSATMYSVTRNGNTLTVTIKENTRTESRADFFNVKASDGSKLQKISLSQSGKSSSSSSSTQKSATVYSVSADHNVMYNGEKCMKIHSHFSVYNMKGQKVYVIAWLYDNNNNYQTSYRTEARYDHNINDSHSVMAWETVTPRYDNSEWKDYVLYLPNELISKSGYVVVELREYSTGKTLKKSEKITFTLN